MIDNNSTITECLALLKKLGAASAKFIFRDGRDRPLAAVVIVRGREESEEIVSAFEAITSAWSAGRPSCSVLAWRDPKDAPRNQTFLVAVEERDTKTVYSAHHDAAGKWVCPKYGIAVRGTVYAWAEFPGLPKKGGA